MAERAADSPGDGEEKTARPWTHPQWRPLEEYVVVIEGLPTAKDYGLTPRKLKSTISLIRSGHERVYPSKVDIRDGQTVVFHFPKKDSIALDDKHVEFQLFMKKIHLNRKFVLKEMQFRGQLEL